MKKIVKKLAGVLFILLGAMIISFPSLIECVIKYGILVTIISFLVMIIMAAFATCLIYRGICLLISVNGGTDYE